MSSRRSSEGTTVQPTASFCTQSVIVNCTADSAVATAASRKRRLEGLSRVSWKLSRTVLRGAVGGNADCLLDPKEGKPPKQPYAFELSSGGIFAFAGLWDAWRDKDGHWLQSFAIVTTEANELMSRIHSRMPVILHRGIMTAGWTGKRRNGCRSICCVPTSPKRWKSTKPIRR